MRRTPGWQPPRAQPSLANTSTTSGNLNIQELAGCSKTNQTLRLCTTSNKTNVFSTIVFARRTGSLLVSPKALPARRLWNEELRKMNNEQGVLPQ